MDIIKAKDISYSYDNENDVLHHISFNIKSGTYTTIIGHNGSGKSTIAKLLVGLFAPKSGTIEINNQILNEETVYKIRKKIGIVFQNPDNQFIGATVSDDIAFGLENHQIQTDEMQNIINKYAKEVHMEDYLESEPTKLSGGQKQRVAIAGVLAMKPDIIIMDEATSMLDPQGRKEINNLISNIHKDKNITIVAITHDIEQVAISDYTIVMDKGNVVMEGIPKDILIKEKELIELKLDIPFTFKLQKELNKIGVKVNEKINKEKMVEELCQLNMKK
ncbi:MAG: energy-coupling factor transporter ATPase [Erysipelotrichaceae bacterium]